MKNDQKDLHKDQHKKEERPLISRLETLKHNIAGFLQSETDKLPTQMRKTFFIMLGLFIATVSIGMIINAVKSGKHTEIKVGSIQLPRVETTGALWDPLVSQEEFQKVVSFKLSMDSLRQTTSGKLIYDSLMKNRAGLFDSIEMVVALYMTKR